MERTDNGKSALKLREDSYLRLEINKPVKFIASWVDVNHGIEIFAGPEDGSPILLQMQVIPL